MKLPISEQFIRFCLVGVTNTIVNYAVYAILLKILLINYMVAGACGFMSGAVTGFFINRAWTFKSNVTISKNLMLYLIINAVSLGINGLVQILTVEGLGIAEIYSQFFGIIVTTFTNYFAVKYFIFNRVNPANYRS